MANYAYAKDQQEVIMLYGFDSKLDALEHIKSHVNRVWGRSAKPTLENILEVMVYEPSVIYGSSDLQQRALNYLRSKNIWELDLSNGATTSIKHAGGIKSVFDLICAFNKIAAQNGTGFKKMEDIKAELRRIGIVIPNDYMYSDGSLIAINSRNALDFFIDKKVFAFT